MLILGIKNHSKLFIAIKSKGNFNNYSKNQKIYNRIKKLAIINHDNYFKTHPDCLNENMSPELHYIYYGFKDEVETKKYYVNHLFNLDFYKNAYLKDSNQDPLFHYVLNGFFKQFLINPLDYNYINTLEIPLQDQYDNQLSEKINENIANFNYITDKKITIPYLLSNNKFKTNKIRVGVFTNDPFENLAPCPYIRIHEPLKELSKSNKYIFFMYGMDSFTMMDLNQILKEKQFDIIIVQRILPFLDLLLKKAKKNNIKIIYETDDDLLGVEKNSPSFDYVDRVRGEITNFIDNADIVTVTTPALASKISNKNVKVIRNYLVKGMNVKKSIKKESKIKLGYYGTLTHSKDLFLIKDVILELKERMLNKYDIEFDFEIIGGFNEEDNVSEGWYKSIELPKDSMNFKKFIKWLQNTVDWDIGVVPLENSEFNKGKSELKYIELTAMGIPGVFSDVEVYNSVVNDGYNGLLANSKDQWIDKLELLILDKTLRDKIHKNAKKDILDNYILENRVKQWDNILSNI